MNNSGLQRDESLRRVDQQQTAWDVIVIGGGATGIGIALDASSRGLSVLLVEQSDFGKGTSSRSTKLVHGGVRYLQQGNLTLVRDALRERTLLRDNAPHLVHDMPFLIPCRSLWERFLYGVGLKVYDFLATRNSFGRSHGISAYAAAERVPALRRDRLRGGVIYHDGQFDDARLLINMARTAADQGACLVNYCRCSELLKDDDRKVSGVKFVDCESDREYTATASCVVNAAGPFCDAIRRLDDANCKPMIAASQGIHLVLPHRFFPGDTAMIVPKTSDGRVIFVIPWHDHAIVGTTDTPISEVPVEPTPRPEEIEFLLETLADYLSLPPKVEDVLSVFTGVRPLVRNDKSSRTASLSRDHVVKIAPSGLVTITGGKWTTVRKMGEDCVDRVVVANNLNATECKTKSTRLHGFMPFDAQSPHNPRSYYGSDLAEIKQLEMETPELARQLCDLPPLFASDVVWAVRYEMARTVEDILARRSRVLFLNARKAVGIAPEVARLMAAELRQTEAWRREQLESFAAVSEHYLPPKS